MPFTAEDASLFHFDGETFDFNLQFEHLFFSILPSALFIPTSLWRTLCQARKPTVVDARGFQLLKLSAIVIYAGLELTLLVLAAAEAIPTTSMFIASSVLNLMSAFCMVSLSLLDHSRSPRPSFLLNSYLLLTLIFDVAQTRTLFLSSVGRPELTYSSIFCAAIALKAGVLLLEAHQKTRWVTWDAKKHSPEETSGVFSLGVFFWLNRLFLLGYKTILKSESLYPLDSSFNSEALHEQFVKNVDYSKLKGDKFGLLKVLIRTLKLQLVIPIVPRLALVGFTFCQPLFIERLLVYLSQPEADPNIGYGLIGASVFIYSGMAISWALCWYYQHRLRTMVQSILVAETFAGATGSRLGSNDDGAALTLMSTDMERIKMGIRDLHEIWACIIQVGLAAWMLFQRLGVAFVASIGVVIACSAGLGILVSFTGDSQRAWMSGVQKRVGLTATAIGGMKSLKIAGLSTAVSDYIQQLRVDELAAGARFRKISLIAAIFAWLPQIISPPLTFAVTRHTLDASTMFTSLSFLSLLSSPLSRVFQSIPDLISALACLGRIQAFLESDCHHDFRQNLAEQWRDTEKRHDPESAPHPSDSIAIRNASFGWKQDKAVLQNISTQISRASLTMVIGPVGSGKSTLCKALLGEIPFSDGSVTMHTQLRHVGFCEQTPFLWNGTIRDNIVGYSQFDTRRYTDVIKATALSVDLATLPQGDATNIGSDGVALSGGQKQRVSLARALYLDSDLLVLDDVFSGLDADTEEQVFQNVFGNDGLLRSRKSTVVICTHSVRHLPAADYIIALNDGRIVEQGSFNSLSTRPGYVQRLGFKTGLETTTNAASSPKRKPASTVAKGGTSLPVTQGPEVDAVRPVGDTSVYKHYIKSMGWFVAGCGLFFAALWGLFTNFPTIWLTYWSDAGTSGYQSHSHAYYAGIYALLQVSAIIALLLLGIALFIVSVKKAGAKLHKQVLQTLMKAPLSFLTKTDTGVVTNLFSQDLNLIDTELPDATLNTLFCTFQCLGQAAVMLTSSLYLAISYPILGGLLYGVQKFYLRTSRQLRLLDLEAKSPLYTHFLDTIKGIATLRSFGFLTDDIHKNAQLIDSSQRPAYLLLMIQEWLNLVLNLVVMIIAAVLTTLAVCMRSNSAFAGASLFSLMSFGTNLSGIVVYYTKLETSIGAIARLKTFNETVAPEDQDDEDIVPDENWPERGMVELKGASARYGPKSDDSNTESEIPLALDNITLTIQPGEKVAICGRTGSGKSSLLALLLKILDPLSTATGESQISIDNTPLDRIDRRTLRQRLIALPQDPVFLPDGSTFRTNLDPSHAATAAECQAVLESIGLWDFVQLRDGLDAPFNTGTFSAGQKQLFSLGRALLRRIIRGRSSSHPGVGNGNGGILLLDEVSSSVDRETERVMQMIIQAEFKDYTVIAVSHRLDMIMDFDRVVVMDQGSVVEVGNPETLKGVPGSRFGELVGAAI